MNLEKIEFHGFKSFADKTSIELSDGVTAIVGPNGCGKSNIADGVRWTLGEQSYKSLRGKGGMADVIFSGCDTRKSLSYCDVSLHFNNEGGKVFPNLTYDKVVITRKLDKSGVSEYLLNNNRVRLKDIISLLHDTGIGKEGYSIIGQGKVQEIVAARPEDRRQIFEEAAGISKFRAQKDEAEKNLERTKLNLQTQNEIIAEIEKQLNPLRKQAENAKIYFALKDQLKNEEVNSYIYMYENNQAMKDRIKARLDKIDIDLEDIQNKYAEIFKEGQDLFNENRLMDVTFTQTTNELTTLKVDAAHLEGDIKVIQEKLANLQENKQRLDQELFENREASTKNEQAIIDTKAERDRVAKEYDDLKQDYDVANNLLSALNATLEGSENALQGSNEAYISSLEELGQLQNNLVMYKSTNAANESRRQSLLDIVKEQKAELSAIDTDYAIANSNYNNAIQKNNEKLSEKFEADKDKQDATDSITEIDETISKLKSNVNTFAMQKQFFQQAKEEYAGYSEAVKRLMNDAKIDISISDRIMGVLAEVMDVPEKYTTAIEYALGTNLQTILVKNTNDANELIDYLKRKQYGRVTFRPLTSCAEKTLVGPDKLALNEPGVIGLASELVNCENKFKPFISSYLGTTVVVDTVYTAASIQRKYNFNFKIVTLDGDIYARSGDITGGSTKGTAGLLSLDQKINDAEQKLQSAQKNLTQMEQLRVSRSQEIGELTHKIDELTIEIGELRVAIGLYEDKVESCKARREKIEPLYNANIKELEDLDININELNGKISAIEKLQDDVEKNKEKYNALFAQNKEKSGSQKSEREELVAKVMELGTKNAEKKADLDRLDAELFRLDKEKADIEDEKRDIEADLAENKVHLDNIAGSQTKELSPEELERIGILEAQLENMSKRRTEISDRMSEIELQKQTFINVQNDLKEKRTKEEYLLQKCDDDMIAMQQYILEEYELTYGTCLDLRQEDYEYNGSKTRILEIKRSIAKLGDVNQTAVQTLAETEERYNQNIVQRDDIQKAIADIEEVIKSLLGEMRDKFIEAFNKISENFQTIFVQLFGGGKGQLRLNMENTTDVLEAGIDIYASPAGKRVSNISLLSGGEQSLTAIAILFSIIALNPMPFCILDEIDAALDDTNANLFAEFLQKYSEHTQFVVITHKKPTMVKANTLFGVTMQERGVTKFVTVELESAERFIEEETKRIESMKK